MLRRRKRIAEPEVEDFLRFRCHLSANDRHTRRKNLDQRWNAEFLVRTGDVASRGYRLGLPLFGRYPSDLGREPRVRFGIDRPVLDLGTGRILAEIVIAFPVLRRSDRPRHKATTAVRTNVAQKGIDTSGAERAFIRADARFE